MIQQNTEWLLSLKSYQSILTFFFFQKNGKAESYDAFIV